MNAPSSLPTGTIPFRFTDIEGSTALWEAYPDAMQLTVARHDSLLRQAIAARMGLLTGEACGRRLLRRDAQRLRPPVGAPLPHAEPATRDARGWLNREPRAGMVNFTAAWAKGRALSLEHAVALALGQGI